MPGDCTVMLAALQAVKSEEGRMHSDLARFLGKRRRQGANRAVHLGYRLIEQAVAAAQPYVGIPVAGCLPAAMATAG
jgi:hypothetical protein